MYRNKNVIKMSITMLAAVCMFVSGCSKKNPSTVNPESYNIVRPAFTPDYENFGVNEKPSGVNVSYY